MEDVERLEELSKAEKGTLTAYRLLRQAGTSVPDSLQLEVWEIEERHPWLKEPMGMTLEYKTFVGPLGFYHPDGEERFWGPRRV